jgi:hypothetical protein
MCQLFPASIPARASLFACCLRPASCVLAGCRFNITVRLPSVSPDTLTSKPRLRRSLSPRRVPCLPAETTPTLPTTDTCLPTAPPLFAVRYPGIALFSPRGLCSFVQDALAPYHHQPPTTDHTPTQSAHALIAKRSPQLHPPPWHSASQTTMSSSTAGRCGRR